MDDLSEMSIGFLRSTRATNSWICRLAPTASSAQLKVRCTGGSLLQPPQRVDVLESSKGSYSSTICEISKSLCPGPVALCVQGIVRPETPNDFLTSQDSDLEKARRYPRHDPQLARKGARLRHSCGRMLRPSAPPGQDPAHTQQSRSVHFKPEHLVSLIKSGLQEVHLSSPRHLETLSQHGAN
jgi:hypothetical protein